MKKILTAALASTAAVLALAAPASAHHPEITAQAYCETTGAVQIIATVTPWLTDEADRRINPDIAVTDGTVTRHGAFTAPYLVFDAHFPAQRGATVTITATAVAPFGPAGEYGSAGEARSVTITTPEHCRSACPGDNIQGQWTGTDGVCPKVDHDMTPTTVPAKQEMVPVTPVLSPPPVVQTEAPAPPVVLSTTVLSRDADVPTGALPYTGAQSTILAAVALGLVGIGVIVVRLGRVYR